MNRRDGREAIFEDAPDWEIFMATLAETCRKTGWQVHAWCLMPNLFHLMVETPQPNSAVGMRWLLST
jgi:REP element-mobilizing transposase RayT